MFGRRCLKGWQLSPAYDVVPNIGENVEHSLKFQYSELPPNENELLPLGKQFGLSTEVASDVFRDVYNVVLTWRELFSQFGVPELEIERLGKGIESRLNRYESLI